ncbi:hypothetical protein B0J14DRAFT_74799 [Halenospora varia]|nr:hypothetical protein B0J14DRAFT_74799 [Halenospora varia]
MNVPRNLINDKKCYLMKVPPGVHPFLSFFLALMIELEVRMHIYRHLLFPTEETEGCQLSRDDDGLYDDSCSDGEDVDMEEYDKHWDLPTIPNLTAEPAISSQKPKRPRRSGPGYTVVRHLAILRVNRLVHTEAIGILHSELRLQIKLNDIRHLPPPGADLTGRSKNVWRHNPLCGLPTRDNQGRYIYPKGTKMNGRLDPHIFARFQNLEFEASFLHGSLGYSNGYIKAIPVSDDMEVNEDNVQSFVTFLVTMDVFQKLATILHNSERVRLEVYLNIDVDADFAPAVEQAQRWESREDESDDGFTSYNAANKAVLRRVIEVCIERGLMSPLEKLTTVSQFDLDIGCEMDLDDDDGGDSDDLDEDVNLDVLMAGEWHLPEKHNDIVKEMKLRIERNFKPKEHGTSLG